MSNYLKSILGVRSDDRLFSAGLMQLEKMTGSSGVDARLIADIMTKAHVIMRKLGLDTTDTTEHELYFALNAAVRRKTADLLLADMDYVLFIIGGKVVSFNLIDVIENYHHELPFEKRIISHGRRSLRGELVGRYIDHGRTDATTAKEVAGHMGLLPESDAWYTNYNHKNNQSGNSPKEQKK